MNWLQLRKKIDSGETGDKVPVEDPAAAPLGTDEEAGGGATSERDIAAAARRQDQPDFRRSEGRGRPVAVIILAGLVVTAAVLLAAAWIWG